MIEIKDLAKIYNTEHGEFKAIENINLTIEDLSLIHISAAAERLAMAAQAGQASGTADLAAIFSNAVVMGDSQAEALEAYAVLPSQSVAATIGRSIITGEEDFSKTVSRSPEQDVYKRQR